MADIYINGTHSENEISVDNSLDNVSVRVSLSAEDISIIENASNNDTFEVILTIDGCTAKIRGDKSAFDITRQIRFDDFEPPLSRNSNKRISGNTVLFLGGFKGNTTPLQGNFLIKE